METRTLEVLRCPYCGGRLELVRTLFHRATDERIDDGILGCHCCVFPVVNGIPVLHLQPGAVDARGHTERGEPERALRSMVGLEADGQASAFEAAIESERSTYQDIVEALGPGFEGGYFLYRFSDPTFVVADAVVRSVAGKVLGGTRRAVDVCGGSGHLTRSLLALSTPPPVLADLYFAKVWLARRFTAPGCEAVCCDGNAPLPFARGAFGFAMCSDAFQYIWTKRQFIGEMLRLVNADGRGRDRAAAPEEAPGAVVINHAHNQLTWSPSHGQPLSPAGYADLFEGIAPRIFPEARLFADVIDRGVVDLSQQDPPEALDDDPALTIVASGHPHVFERHRLDSLTPVQAEGELRLNPLYAVRQDRRTLHLRLQFPSPEYEDEYGACRRYLPEEAVVSAGALEALARGVAEPDVAELVRRRVIVRLPKQYY